MSDERAAAPAVEGWVPAFDGQRPPFAPGHTLSVSHGAYSPRRVDPLARELVELMLADESLGFLRSPAYRLELWAWARAEAQTQLITEWLARAGEATGDGVGDLDDESTRSAYLLLHRVETRAASGRMRLGLNPLARARIGRDVAVGQAASADAARLMARLDELEERGVSVLDDQDDDQDDDEDHEGDGHEGDGPTAGHDGSSEHSQHGEQEDHT